MRTDRGAGKNVSDFLRIFHNYLTFSRVEKKVEKVPWAKKVQSRPCEEFPAWLVRGNFQQGDDWDWAEAAGKEKLLEKWRRRQELEGRLGRAQTEAAQPLLGLTAPESPSWSEEEEEEEEEGWRSAVRGEREELGGLESDSSGQSMVTHIRSPPRVTVLEEEEEEEGEEDVTIRTPERLGERLVNEIPSPPPILSPGEVPVIGWNILRLNGKRLKLI